MYTNCVSLKVICVSLNLNLCIFKVHCDENSLCTCNIVSIFTLTLYQFETSKKVISFKGTNVEKGNHFSRSVLSLNFS